jgi:predicted nuclease with RNAse H fold
VCALAGASTVVGIDLAAGRGVTALAALAVDQGEPARLDALTYPKTDDEITADALRLRPAVIAIDAPLTLPGPVAAALTGVEWGGQPSPYTRAAERDGLWRELGVRPLPVSFLAGLTFRAIPLAARLRAALPETTIIEAFPTASLRALGIKSPGEGPVAKTRPEARRAAQSALSAWVRGLPPMYEASEALDADALDAVVAALTALAHSRGLTRAAGDPAEGCIIIIDPTARAALRAC